MYIIDSCALINLLNSGLADPFGRHFASNICFQGLVEDGCTSISSEIYEMVVKGYLSKFDGSLVGANKVSNIALSYSLGIGESECLAIAKDHGYDFICDDRKARKTARSFLPESSRITGSIGILCELIDAGHVSAAQAADALCQIRDCGGHVPRFDFDSRKII